MANGIAFVTFSRSAAVLPPPLHPLTFIRHRGKTVKTSIDSSVSHELHFGRTCFPILRLGNAPLRWTSHPFAVHRATGVSFATGIVCIDRMVDVGVYNSMLFVITERLDATGRSATPKSWLF